MSVGGVMPFPVTRADFRKHSKHGKMSLIWRQKNRSKRRAALALTFSRMKLGHPLTIKAEQAPKALGKPSDRRRWARNKLKQEARS